MKQNLVLKSALALAFGAASAGAMAGSALVGSAWNTPVNVNNYATEIFGTGSDETVIKLQDTYYSIRNMTYVATDVVTVKYTLGGGAVFGQVVNDANLATYFTAGADFGGATVQSGGQIGDNTIVIQMTVAGAVNVAGTSSVAVAASAANTVKFGGFTVKSLKNALSPNNGTVLMGIESRNTSNVNADQNFDTVAALTVMHSNDAFKLTTTVGDAATDYINVATGAKKFTDVAGSTAFTAAAPRTQIALGTIRVERVTSPAGFTTVLKEDGTSLFDIQGADSGQITIEGTFGSFSANNAASLVTGTCAVPGSTLASTKVDSASKDFIFSAAPVVNQTYTLCATTNTTSVIDETTSKATLAMDFFNVRYVDRNYVGSLMTQLKYNGASEDVPYMLSGDNAYSTYLRVQNMSDVAGRVRVTCLKNNGSVAADAGTAWTESATLVDSLGAYQSKIFTAAEVATACGANGAASGSEFSYVRVTGEVAKLDAIQFMFNPNGTVTQFMVNNSNINSGIKNQ